MNDQIKWKIEDVPTDAIMRRKMGITSFYGQHPTANYIRDYGHDVHELRNDCSWPELKEMIYKRENWKWISEGPRLS